MIIISSIEIQHFRSIIKLEQGIQPNDLNIIVGQNDIGKSNFLKALNLFFNGETEIGNVFRFNDDFSHLAVTPNKKAPEITIRIEFQIPDRFKDNENLVWTKIWRREGLHLDQILTKSGREPSGKNRALQWVKKIMFKYVPAVRGTEYFNHLMGELHDSLSEINPTAFNDVSQKFADGLKSQVELLVKNIATELGYTSEIGMPSDFKSLFSTLDFSLNKGGLVVSLNKRGDGIKAQHIPVILKFIASHYKSISGKAVINPETIWGFEEPENNMEMGNAFKLAKVFANYSSDIQIFINTHSPAFYTLAKAQPVSTNLYLVKLGNGTYLSHLTMDAIPIFDEEMGLLPIISEYIKEEVERRQFVEKQYEELKKISSQTTCLVLSEDSDLTLIKTLFEIQGFDMTFTEFVTYETRTNLLAAMQSARLPLTDRPHLKHIIFHRDRDIYNDDEPDRDIVMTRLNKLNENSSINHHLFQTDGYDLEAYFLNAEHIHALYPSFTKTRIEKFIQEATVESEKKSLHKLYNKAEQMRIELERQGRKREYSVGNAIDELEALYHSNPSRYRYGKGVLGLLTAKLAKGNGPIDLRQPTTKIIIPQLQPIVKNLKVTQKRLLEKVKKKPKQ